MSDYYEDYWVDKEEQMPDFKFKWPAIKQYIPTKKSKVLEYGCGKGFILHTVSKYNPKATLTGVDISKEAIRHAKKKYKNISFSVIKPDTKLPYRKNSFDYVMCLDVIEHVMDVELVLAEFNRVLKPGGRLLVSTPYHGMVKNMLIVMLGYFDFVFNPTGPHIRFFTKKSLTQCLSDANFDIDVTGYCGRIYPISHCMYMLATKA